MPLAVNVVVDAKGAVRLRPGITPWDGFESVRPAFVPDIRQACVGLLPHGEGVGFGTSWTRIAGTNNWTLLGTLAPMILSSSTGTPVFPQKGDRVFAWSSVVFGAFEPQLYGPWVVLEPGVYEGNDPVITRADDVLSYGATFPIVGTSGAIEYNLKYFVLKTEGAIVVDTTPLDFELLDSVTSLGAPLGSAVIGMISYGDALVYVTADRKIHSLSSISGYVPLSSDDPLTKLDGGGRPSFVQGRNMLCIAGGGAIQKWTGSGLSARLKNTGNPTGLLPGVTSPGGPPPDAIGISGIAQRLIAATANKSGQIWWSGPLEEYENWDFTNGASYIQAAAKPDPLVALHDNTSEVFAFGSLTIQVFDPTSLAIDQNDPNNILDFATNRTMNIGVTAPDAIVPVDDTFAIIDRQRRAIITDGRTYTDISRSITKLLRDLGSIDDAWGFRMRMGRFDCVVWMFPSAGYGVIWDQQTGNWSEWRAWDKGPQSVAITSAYNWAEHDVFLVGLANGQIAKLDDAANLDLGAPIKVDLISGFQSRGSGAQKNTETMLVTFQRNAYPTADTGHGPPGGFVRISLRDQQGAWRVLANKVMSETMNPCIQIRSLGVYRTRQWRVEYTGDDRFGFIGAQEEFEILGA